MRNHMRYINRGFIGVALLASLAACGGGGNFSGGSTSSGASGGGVHTGTSLVELGNGVGTKFVQGTLAVQVTKLSAGGSTDVTATLVDTNNSNALYTQSAVVTFTSNCVAAGTASFGTSSVTTTNGTAIAVYTAAGCSGTDSITATATVGTATLTATGSINVQAPTIGSIQFISASPIVISLEGVGGVSSSKVTFQVNDANGNPVGNTLVDFKLVTTSGGVTIAPTSGLTGSNGQVSTFVQAGTVHTSVNVEATVDKTTVGTETPNAIAISTGIPVQTRFSLAISTHNLSYAFDHDGVTDTVGVFAVDRYGNPASPGTNILFHATGGVISGTCPNSTNPSTACGECQTDATGHCTVTYTSEGNRPDPTTNSALDVLGHAHIFAYTVGEENYEDNDSDGAFDNGDGFTASTSDSFYGFNQPQGDNIGDPYMDQNENGHYDIGEPYANIANSNAVPRRAPDGHWYGAGCGGFGSNSTSVTNSSGHQVTCANALTMIGKDDCIVMSTDGAIINGITAGETITTGGPAISFTITDTNGNPIGSGSTVAIVPVNVAGATLTLAPSSGGTSYTQGDQGCSSTPAVTFTVTSTAGTGTPSGAFYILYTSGPSPTGVTIAPITVQSLQVTIQ